MLSKTVTRRWSQTPPCTLIRVRTLESTEGRISPIHIEHIDQIYDKSLFMQRNMVRTGDATSGSQVSCR